MKNMKEEADKVVEEAVNHTHFKTSIASALQRAYEDGAFEERKLLREELEKYKGDSVVAKLLLDKFAEQ